MKHCMLYLETLGTIPGAAVISIGAVQFDLDGKVGETFYQNISAASCRELGLVEDPDTIAWWAKQSQEAQALVVKDPKPVTSVASAFGTWFLRRGCEFVWGHGSVFDVTLWEAVCRRVGIAPPWKFYNVRDIRTVFHVFDFDVRTMGRVGTHHDALDDARFQVNCVAAALKPIRAKPPIGGVFE